jgi:hypothetical protein
MADAAGLFYAGMSGFRPDSKDYRLSDLGSMAIDLWL